MTVSVSMTEQQVRWRRWLLERNRRGMRSLLWIVVTLYPFFGVLDYLVAPRAWLWLLYGTRALVTVITIAMFRVIKSAWFDRAPDALSSGFILLISLGISLMTVFMGGLASPYYAGLSLTIVATGLLFVWPTRVVVGTHVSIVASFLIPNLLLGDHVDPITAISNLFFLCSTAIIAGTGQILTYRSQAEQLANQLIIEQTKSNLESAHAQLQQLDRFKSEFFANITHELKTPLTMLLAPLELLVDGEMGRVSEAQKSTFVSMQRSGMKLLRLIEDLLDLSKLEESRLRLRIAEQDLAAYLEGLIAQVQPLAQRKGITLSYEGAAKEAWVWCDIERLERVLINLLSNATKFTPSGGKVSVRLADEGTSVRIDVVDTGPGFTQEVEEKLFQRFFQADMGGTRRYGGTGIGLALAKELVVLHGGEITARSEPGAGATFSVRLHKGRDHFPPDVLDRHSSAAAPFAGPSAADRGGSEWKMAADGKFRLIDIDEATDQRVVERDPDEGRRRYTALVVEDTPDVVRMVRLALHHDFRVMSAGDGRRGIELALQHRPAVIITDLMMPEVDGLELTRRLRADPRTQHVPIVLLTARGDLPDRVSGLEAGANAYLTKPFSSKELVTTVRSLLRSQEATADIVLTEKLDSLETVAGGLAHEILNPLNYLKNAVGCIQRDVGALLEASRTARDPALAARTRQMFEVAQTGVTRIERTVELMIRYSREGFSRVPQAYDAYQAVRDVVAVVTPTISRPVEVCFDLQGDGQVECVPEELNQVLTNLVQNALESVPPGRTARLEIRGSVEDGALRLSVGDNGSGIAPDDVAKVFNAFYTTKEVGRGIGMGLTITRRIVSALGGKISLRSELGQGTVFELQLPVSNPARRHPSHAA